jgi:predicted O-methyltransferase YrrM
MCTAFARRLADRNPQLLLEALGPKLNRSPSLATMPFDLVPSAPLQFEDLAGLFASTSLDHGVIAMTVRQTAYLFGVVRRMQPHKVIEIGRYKGGSTLTIAAAMSGQGQFWSIDIGEKEARLHQHGPTRTFDDEIRDICARFSLHVTLLVGDSRTIQVDTGEVDLVFIDGDHSYEGVRNDFERFGRRVRIGGAVLFDDACDEAMFRTHSESVGKLLKEILTEQSFRLVKSVNRLAHIERVK